MNFPAPVRKVAGQVRTNASPNQRVANAMSAWAKARHCILPAEAIYEPDWRSGKHVPTRFTMADGEPMGIAGLWQPWRAPTGEWVNSFTTITINADDHPLMKHMHRPDPKRPPEMQDKRMVAILPAAQYSEWLDAPAERSMQFLRPYPAELMVMTAEPVVKAVPDLDVGLNLLNQ